MATRGLNKVMIIGNLGRDPQMRYTSGGTPVTNFTVAVNRVMRSREGESREETEWFSVVAWEKLAETCNEYLKKGAKVYIEGRLQTRKYTDRDGQERTAVEVVAHDMVMLDSRAARPEAGPGAAPGAEADGGQDDTDDMPF